MSIKSLSHNTMFCKKPLMVFWGNLLPSSALIYWWFGWVIITVCSASSCPLSFIVWEDQSQNGFKWVLVWFCGYSEGFFKGIMHGKAS